MLLRSDDYMIIFLIIKRKIKWIRVIARKISPSVDTSPWRSSLKPSKRVAESVVSSKNSVTDMSDSAIECSDLDLTRNSSAYLPDSDHLGALNESSDEASSISEIDVKVSCPCRSHVGRVLLDEVFRLSPEQLFEILFSEVPWYRQFTSLLKETAQSRLFDSISGYMASPWITNQTLPTSSTRTATYTMALNHAMAPKCTIVTEKQECTEFERLSEGFVVMKESRNAGIPYAESFLIQCTYCITRVDPRHSRLLIHGGIIYKKSIWSIVRGYIERSTYTGLEDHYAALGETLKVHCERNADASSCCSDLSVQRFNDDQLVDRRLQHASDIDVLNSREYEHEEASSTIPVHVAAKISSVPTRGLRLRRLRTATEEAQTQTMPVMVTSDLTYYARLIITLLTTLILLHIFTLLKLSSTETPQRCSIKDRFADMLAWNSDTTTVANVMQLDSAEKTQSSVARFSATIDRIHKKLGQTHGIWSSADEP
uniref:VASt domain-containing protein n=1 Tax=Parascaris univalens TaxID=6257 RepID=A0A915B2G6_PARUN